MISIFILSSCGSRYIYDDRAEALVSGADIDQTLQVAEYVMTNRGRGKSLGLWVMRDQIITPAQAEKISVLYFRHASEMKSGFDIWHFSWAIANLYKHGDEEIQAILASAFQDASERARQAEGMADRMTNDDKRIHMGDYHVFARRAKQSMLVVPGNDKFVQSFKEFLAGQR